MMMIMLAFTHRLGV